jgi:hypothetical protein
MQILIALNDGATVRAADGKRFAVPAGRAVVLPARGDGSFVLEGETNAEVMRVSTGIS